MDRMEFVQGRFLKHLVGIYPAQGFEYDLLSSKFNYCSLHRRRICVPFKFLHNLLQGKLNCPWLLDRLNFLFLLPRSRLRAVFDCGAVMVWCMISGLADVKQFV